MRKRTLILAVAAWAVPALASAQGLFEGARGGYADGERRAGVVGGLVGGAMGAGVGTVNGALGIRPEPVVVDPGYAPETPRRHRRRRHAG